MKTSDVLYHRVTFMLLLITSSLFYSTAIHAKSYSEYTSLKDKDCTKDSSAPYYLVNCPTKAAYKLSVFGSDIRFGLQIKHGETAISYEPSLPFNVGDRAEWRYHIANDKKIYDALIYRVYTAQLNNNQVGLFLPPAQDKQELIVVRLDKNRSCIIGIIPQSKNMNLIARQVADNHTAKCIK